MFYDVCLFCREPIPYQIPVKASWKGQVVKYLFTLNTNMPRFRKGISPPVLSKRLLRVSDMVWAPCKTNIHHKTSTIDLKRPATKEKTTKRYQHTFSTLRLQEDLLARGRGSLQLCHRKPSSNKQAIRQQSAVVSQAHHQYVGRQLRTSITYIIGDIAHDCRLNLR